MHLYNDWAFWAIPSLQQKTLKTFLILNAQSSAQLSLLSCANKKDHFWGRECREGSFWFTGYFRTWWMQNTRNLILPGEHILIAIIILSQCSEKCHISSHRTIEWELQDKQSKAAWRKVVGNSLSCSSVLFLVSDFIFMHLTYFF